MSPSKPKLCRHHEDRVKKLITEPGNPNLIISAAEDSTGESFVPLPPVLAQLFNSSLHSSWHVRGM